MYPTRVDHEDQPGSLTPAGVSPEFRRCAILCGDVGLGHQNSGPESWEGGYGPHADGQVELTRSL